MQLRVGGVEKFGPAGDVPVNVIKNQMPMRALHQVLTHTLEEADIAFNEETDIYQKYVAHIAQNARDKRFANEGESVTLDKFHLVRLISSSTCRVEQEFALKSA